MVDYELGIGHYWGNVDFTDWTFNDNKTCSASISVPDDEHVVFNGCSCASHQFADRKVLQSDNRDSLLWNHWWGYNYFRVDLTDDCPEN